MSCKYQDSLNGKSCQYGNWGILGVYAPSDRLKFDRFFGVYLGIGQPEKPSNFCSGWLVLGENGLSMPRFTGADCRIKPA